MPLFGHNNNNNNNNTATTGAGTRGLARTEVDPMYNNERGPNQDATGGQLAGYMVPGVGLVSAEQAAQMQAINFEQKGTTGPLAAHSQYRDSGMGMGTGHQNNPIPQGGLAQGTGVPLEGDPMHDNQRGSVAKRGVEGAAVGGLAGHEGHHGHTARDAALVGAGGAAYEHEHNKHHNQNMMQGGNTGATGTTGGGMGVSSNQGNNTNMPDLAQAKKLEKSAKIENIIGTLTGNTAKKEEAFEKKAEAAQIREQVRHLSAAEELEAQAQRARGVAVGAGAHPSVATQGGANPGVQPSYGPGQGAPVGGGVGGGGFGGLK
ncbi:hypothetical protein FRB98_000892 [Tulasnella sp. 332]|nr:hypothetical protein FRB98_000892 [Tulasnella sp. 332]